MKFIVPFVLASIAIALLTGCQTQEDQVQHEQDRKQSMMLKQMQRQQEQAEKASRQ
jgi:outer membrane biogenesis lipoprotein LolB